MAKDLPFFKFIPSEWRDGAITLCSYGAQGYFINICALYWSRECELSGDFLFQKLPPSDQDFMKELIRFDVLKIDQSDPQKYTGGKVVISFLDEQAQELSVNKNWGKNMVDKREAKRTDERTDKRVDERTNVSSRSSSGLSARSTKREDKIRKDTVDKHDSVLSTSVVSNGQKLRTGFMPAYAMPLNQAQEKRLDELSGKFYKEVYAKGDELGDKMITEMDMPDNVMLEFYERYEKYKSGVDEIDFEKVLQVAKSMKA